MRHSESERQFCLLLPWHSWHKQRLLQELLDMLTPPSWKRSVPNDLRDFFWPCVLLLYNRNRGREQLYLFKRILCSDTHTHKWCVSFGIILFLMIYAMVADDWEEFSCRRREQVGSCSLLLPKQMITHGNCSLFLLGGEPRIVGASRVGLSAQCIHWNKALSAFTLTTVLSVVSTLLGTAEFHHLPLWVCMR